MKPNPRGKSGEEYAARILRQHGYAILARNFSCRRGEVDIIATIGDIIVFAEVKTRRQNSMVSGAEAVTPGKQRKIIAAALFYLQGHPCDLQPRFDVLCVETGPDGEPCTYEHFQGAFDGEAYEKHY